MEVAHLIEVRVPNDVGLGRFAQFIDVALEGAGIEFLWRDEAVVWFDQGPQHARCTYELTDLKRSLDVILDALAASHAPPDTTVRVGHPEEKSYRLGDLARGI
jgi:hypothetical protein